MIANAARSRSGVKRIDPGHYEWTGGNSTRRDSSLIALPASSCSTAVGMNSLSVTPRNDETAYAVLDNSYPYLHIPAFPSKPQGASCVKPPGRTHDLTANSNRYITIVIMPPKTVLTGEHIIDGAIRVVRESGPEALTTRSVAGALGCSTQPIYSVFGSIDALLEATVDRALEIAVAHELSTPDPESAFLGIGLAYLDFSRSEPHLFQLLMTRGRERLSPSAAAWPFAGLTEQMRSDCALSELPDERLQRLLKNMFIYTHGLASLAPAKPTEEDLANERTLLRDVGGRMIALAVMEESGQFDLEAVARRFHL
jgi:AcrR family transcriptional regulator